MPGKDDPPPALALDRQLVAARHLFMGGACSRALRCGREAPFHLLSKEEIIEVHRESPDGGGDLDTAPFLERQMSKADRQRCSGAAVRRTVHRGAVSRIVSMTGSTASATIAIMMPGAVAQPVRSTSHCAP